MKNLYFIIFLLLLTGCLQTKTNLVSNSLMCQDKNATNYKKTLPCDCPTNYQLSSDYKSCLDQKIIETKIITRNCTVQPINTIGGVETSNDAGLTWESCAGFSCSQGAINISGQCLVSNISRICASQPTNSINGLEYSADGGIHWSTCSNYQCKINFSMISGQCVQSTQNRSCLNRPINTVGGVEQTINGGLTWGACAGFSCQDGYSFLNNNCIKIIQTRSCSNQPSNTNGGIETSTDAGLNWGVCAGFSCQNGYSLINNKCVQSTQTRTCLNQPNNTNGGVETSIDGGVSWGNCIGFSCNTGSALVNGQCSISNTEVPNYTISKYLVNFQQTGQSLNKPVNINLNVTFDPSLSGTSILGMCVYASPRYIVINETWWKNTSTTNADRQYLIFHEMAHCILNRPHKMETTFLVDYPTMAVPVSMMYPSIMSSTIYKNNMNYYHSELFDETISTQNVALYYNQQSQFNNNYYSMALMAPLEINVQKTMMVNGKIVCADKSMSL
jgi:hypothetical protein